MKLLPFLLIIISGCNSYREESLRASQISIPLDSLTQTSDSVNDALRNMKREMAVAIGYAKEVVSLRKERAAIESPVSVEKYADAYYYLEDEKDKKIRELTEKILSYEREIARLKRNIALDSEFHKTIGKVVPEYLETDPPKPNEKSLIINLDKKLRGDGELSESGVRVYLIAFKKPKEVKRLMRYDISCETNYINSLGAREAYFYGGLYFLNDVPPGKYLVKVCAYYGNYMVIKRDTDGYQMVAMKLSPPIQ